ncbi:hypothetical protein CYMTET_7267 [Cymbomonas tetramitiformis]|uniref:Fe2OG dioxygenase domain-containing protein n=1 Tax=Cymbomonas tetramitiformis TaxID=36881 RepID=A0AAE0GVZ0_9CHLO|nr:hypothetical protein CYMTET_7267 [Cymbomonas tetramitiformis]
MSSSNASNFEQIPVVDFSLLDGSLEQRNELILQLREVCHEVGFFYVTNHGLSRELCDRTLEVAGDFFALPMEAKRALDYRQSPSFRGYMSLGCENTGGRTDQREQIEFGVEAPPLPPPPDLPLPPYTRLCGPNQWPATEHCADFRPTLEEFMAGMEQLSRGLMRALALSLDLSEDYFDATFGDSPNVQMKIAKYPPLQALENGGVDEDGVPLLGVGAHSDSGYLSLLLQDGKGGLQAQNGAGQWIDVPPLPGAFVVNLGEMLQLATDGYYLATVHRVQNLPGNAPRISVPYFFNPRLDAFLDPVSLPQSLTWARPAPARESRTHDGENKFFQEYGANAFKSLARSHPEVMRRHHGDLFNIEDK